MNASRDHFTRHRLTVDEYRRMAEHGILAPGVRVELIDGEIIDMTPIGSTHAGIVDHLVRLLSRAVGDTAIVRVQNPVELPSHSEPEPDVTLLRPRDDFYKRALPKPEDVLLLIEVADFTLAYDHDIKAPLYARYRVPEYWIVDVSGERVIAFGDPVDGVYAVQRELADPRAVAPVLLPAAPVDLSALFRT